MPRNLYHQQGDFAVNFAEKFRIMCAAYAEDYAAYDNGFKPTPMKWKKSRNKVKSSSKKTSIIRQIHAVERKIFLIPHESPLSKKTLVLKIEHDDSVMFEAYKVDLKNCGEIYIDNVRPGIWEARWFNSRSAHASNPRGALARLLAQKWGVDMLTGQELSIYSLFKDIVFETPGKKVGNVRHRTYAWPQKVDGVRFVWDYVHPMPVKPAWTPPPSPPRKRSINFPNLTGEKSLL